MGWGKYFVYDMFCKKAIYAVWRKRTKRRYGDSRMHAKFYRELHNRMLEIK